MCDRHGLRFYLSDGSAIGAIRHKGFIPWDDDLDVSMPREDYDKFMSIAASELPSHLCVMSIEKTPGYSNLHGKVQETRREIVEDIERQAGYTLSSGVFLDIFPIDGWSGSRFWYQVNKLRFVLLACAAKFQRTSFKSLTFRGKLSWIVGGFLRPFYSQFKSEADVSRAFQSIYGVRPCAGMPYTARVRCWLDRRLILRADVWGTPTYVEFCGLKVPVAEKYDDYLRQDYGDYMKLPPEEKRRTTHSCDGYHFPWWLGPTAGLRTENKQ